MRGRRSLVESEAVPISNGPYNTILDKRICRNAWRDPLSQLRRAEQLLGMRDVTTRAPKSIEAAIPTRFAKRRALFVEPVRPGALSLARRAALADARGRRSGSPVWIMHRLAQYLSHRRAGPRSCSAVALLPGARGDLTSVRIGRQPGAVVA